jgi:general secretion pathway protein F
MLERTQGLRENVRSAMYYPAIVMVVAALTVLLLLTVVIPEFRPLFEDSGAAMPTLMAALLAAGDSLGHWWWALCLLVLAAVVGLRHHNASRQGRLRRDGWLRRAPLLGDLVVKLELARFCRTLGTLLANGIAVAQALTIAVGSIGNQAIAGSIEDAVLRLKRGEGLARPLMETGAFPRLATQLIQVGEESGQMEAMLVRVADIYDEEVKRALQRLTAILVPVVTIGLGIIVAGIITSMLTALLSTYDLSL